jgi:hypothetical protein
MKTIISLFTCLFFLITISKSQESEYSFKENYKLSAPTKLTVSSHVGTIDVIPSENSEIEVLYIAKKNNKIISINKDDIQKDGILLNVKQDKNSLDILVKYPDNYFKLDFSDQIHVSFELRVPKETDCDLITDDGNISIQGLKSNQKCKTDDGNIDISDITGNIIIRKSDSNIKLFKIRGSVSVNVSDAIVHAEEIIGSVSINASDESMFLKNINGQVHCKAVEGNIELINVNGEITAKTAEGHILFTNLSGSLNAHSMDGNVIGSFLELKKPVTIEAGGGDIDISFTNKLGLDLNIKGKRDNTPLKNFRGSSNKYFMNGRVNGGGIAINLLSIDGKIKLAY